MSRRMDSLSVYLTPSQHAALKALSERTRVPVAVYIRDAVDLFLANLQEPKQEGASS